MTISGVWAVALAVAPVATGIAGYRLALWNWKQAKLEAVTRSAAQMVILLTDSRKMCAGTPDLEFSENELRNWIGGEYSLRLHAALDLLMSKGRAKKSSVPGYWKFD